MISYAQQLTFTKSGDTTPELRWQNFFYDNTVQLFIYVTFTCSNFVNSLEGAAGGLTIEIPYSISLENQMLNYMQQGYIVQAQLLQLKEPASTTTGFTGATIISTYVGRIENISSNLQTLDIQLINLLDLSSALAPPRKVTASLIKGVPSTLRQAL